jgi:hypothetical protein
MANSSVEHLVLSRMFEEKIVSPISKVLSQHEIEASVTYCAPTNNTALWLDLEGNNYIGRLTLWQDGSYYSEALRVSDGISVLSLHGTANNSFVVSSAVEHLLNLLLVVQ